MSRDYSQRNDPYGIARQYTTQSADDINGYTGPEVTANQSSTNDVRGNSILPPRGIPTQAEADAAARDDYAG